MKRFRQERAPHLDELEAHPRLACLEPREQPRQNIVRRRRRVADPEHGPLNAERRLRDVQPRCGAPEVKLLGDGHERTQEPQIHAHHRITDELSLMRQLGIIP